MSAEGGTQSTIRKLWQILNRPQRRGAIAVLALSVVGMIAETLGVGLVIPALAVMTQRDIGARYPAAAPLLRSLGNPTQAQLIILGMVGLVAVYALKAVFLAVLAWYQMRFAYGVQAELSQRLFTTYLRQPYTFHLERNSAQLIRNAITETNLFAQTVLVSGWSVLAESLIAFGVAALMLAVEPIGSVMVMGLLGGAVWAFHAVSRRPVARWGAARQEHEGQRIQHLQQGLGGVKDVKLLGREDEFLRGFGRHNIGYARVGRRFGFVTQLPRLWLEFLAVGGLAALVIVMIWRGRPIEALLPELGLFGVGAFRLVPSANRILSGVQNVRYGLPAVSVLHAELRDVPIHPSETRLGPRPFRSALELENVVVQYAAAERPALDGVTLRIAHGTAVGIIGTTGAGKSTLVDVILGLVPPTHGRVIVDGENIGLNLRGWQDQIGYVPQTIFLTDDTLLRNIAFGIPDSEIEPGALDRAVRAAHLQEFVAELPAGLATVVGERGVRLSGGQRQRIGIARALYHDPSVLVLDEATSALDVETEAEVMGTVAALRGRKTLIVIAHRLATVEYCDRVIRLERGHVVAERAGAAGIVSGAQPSVPVAS